MRGDPSTAVRRRDRNRQAILDAALELIDESGIDGWSMRELAGRVDFTAGALYRYFDSKAALLDALTTQALQELLARLGECQSAAGPLGLLEELGLAYLDFAAARPMLFRLGLLHMPSRRTSLTQQPGNGSPLRRRPGRGPRRDQHRRHHCHRILHRRARHFHDLGRRPRHGRVGTHPPAGIRRRLRHHPPRSPRTHHRRTELSFTHTCIAAISRLVAHGVLRGDPAGEVLAPFSAAGRVGDAPLDQARFLVAALRTARAVLITVACRAVACSCSSRQACSWVRP